MITFNLCCIAIVVGVVVTNPVFAQSPRHARIEREIGRLESVIANLERTLGWLKQIACAAGVEKFCPKKETEVFHAVSTGHTKIISFDVKGTFYANRVAETDETPCEGAFGNICNAVEKGVNVIAASRDIAVYPLGRGSKIKLTSLVDKAACIAQENKVFTVMDTLSDCTRANRDLRTGRCIPGREITNQVDVLIPCEDEGCKEAAQRARIGGICQFRLTKI